MEGILVVNNLNRQWYLNNKKRFENEDINSKIVNYWTNNWIPDKNKIKPGDKITFGENLKGYAYGVFVEAKKMSIEEAYITYKEINGLPNNATLDDFIDMVRSTFKSVPKSFDKDYEIGCIIVDNIKYESCILKSKPNSKIVYVK